MMKELLHWLYSNYELVILVAACILDLVLFLFGVFKKSKKEPIAGVLDALPELINLAEKSGQSGDVKLGFVLDAAKSLMVRYLGCKESEVNEKELRAQIESILSTPQKKG